jgi:predicted Zn-dependent protease
VTESTIIASLRSQCGGPRDGALLRFSLGNALLGQGNADEAITELRRATDFDPLYSAAWKVLGKACVQAGHIDAAAQVWQCGIDAAARRGDKQAEKEMTVFLRRLAKPKL